MLEHHTNRLLRSGISKWARRVPRYYERVLAKTRFNRCGPKVFGFIDGTSRACSMPGYFQGEFFSGHKRCHCMQFLSLTAPDGMILYTFGPTTGRHQDNFLVNSSGLGEEMLPHLSDLLGCGRDKYAVFGDPIFRLTPYVRRGFPRFGRTDAQDMYTKIMNGARVTIEHVFGFVVQNWAFIDFKKQQKVRWTRPALQYLNAQFMTNCLNCIYPNHVSHSFQCPPPSLHEYLHEFEEVQGAPEVPLIARNL